MINNENIDAEKIKTAIRLLTEYVKDPEIAPLVTVLENLKNDTLNQSLLEQLFKEFNELGIIRGAVLTYAPYVNIMLSDEPFDELKP